MGSELSLRAYGVSCRARAERDRPTPHSRRFAPGRHGGRWVPRSPPAVRWGLGWVCFSRALYWMATADLRRTPATFRRIGEAVVALFRGRRDGFEPGPEPNGAGGEPPIPPRLHVRLCSVGGVAS